LNLDDTLAARRVLLKTMWNTPLRRLPRLEPQHISLYELTIEKRTVFGSRFEKGMLPLPNEETQLEMLSFAREFLKKSGFLHYELLNYAKKGYESQHNLLYWANEEYLGLGPGAFSYFKGRAASVIPKVIRNI